MPLCLQPTSLQYVCLHQRRIFTQNAKNGNRFGACVMKSYQPSFLQKYHALVAERKGAVSQAPLSLNLPFPCPRSDSLNFSSQHTPPCNRANKRMRAHHEGRARQGARQVHASQSCVYCLGRFLRCRTLPDLLPASSCTRWKLRRNGPRETGRMRVVRTWCTSRLIFIVTISILPAAFAFSGPPAQFTPNLQISGRPFPLPAVPSGSWRCLDLSA